VALAPRDADAWSNLGGALRHSKDLSGAIEAFKKAIALDKRDPVAWYNLGVTLAAGKDFPGAISAYKEAIAIDSQYVNVWIGLGKALSHSKDLPGATEAYKKAIAIDPQCAAAHNGLAWVLATCSEVRFRDPTRAVALARNAVKLEPKNPEYANTLGVAHYRAGDWKAAIDALEKAVEVRKAGHSEDWFFLAMAHWRLGNKDEARACYDRAVQWMDKNQRKNEGLRRFRAEAAELLELNQQK
jgi:superkiller protein 3